MKDVFDLSGRVSVVMGAGRGLGRAAALAMAQYGADVAAVSRTAAQCEETRRLVEALGRRCRTYVCDVAQQPQVAETVQRIVEDFERIDILLNIAGFTARVPTVEITTEQVRRLTDVNYLGTFWSCQAVGRVMLAQGCGSIVNMSSVGGGLVGLGRGNAAYCATKGAVAALTRDLACEWGRHGIRVNAVAPGWFRTDMTAGIFDNPRFMAQAMTKLPLKRIGLPEDLIGPLVFLASDASAMITGLVLPVDAGSVETCPVEWQDD